MILRALALACVALVVAAVVAAWLGVTVSLDRYRAQTQQAASQALGRPVRLEGDLEARLGFTGGLVVERLRVANPEGWDGDLLELEHAHLDVSLLALLRRQLHLRELVAEDALLALEERADGASNWPFERRSRTGAEDVGGVPAEAPRRGLPLTGFDRLSFERVEVTVVRPEAPASSFRLESLTGSGPPGDPVLLEARGRLGPEPFSLRLSADSIRAGRDRTRPWSAAVELAIADARVALDGRFGFEDEGTKLRRGRVVVLPSGRRAPDLRLHVEGRRLDDFNRLADVDLPPLGPFEVDGRFRLTAEGFDVSDAAVRIGASRLSGGARYAGGTRPSIEIRLESPLIQLDDFRTEGWSAFVSNRSGKEAEPDADAPAQPARILSAENLRRGDTRLEVAVAEVRSGEDVLGRGELLATAQDARARIVLELALPGGSFEMALRAEPAGDMLDASLVMQSERLDYGVLARRIDPQAEAAGWLSLDIDIRSRTRVLDGMLADADGTLAFAIFPENHEADAFDLWATNLLLALLPKFGEGSKLNCAAARMRIEGGRMTQEELLLDTSTMRVGGRVDVDFKTQTIDAIFAPVAKVPRMFSAATPIQVRGTFEDFALGVRPQDVAFTVVRMATSPVLAPLTLLVRGSLERDGSELCEAAVREARSRTDPGSSGDSR